MGPASVAVERGDITALEVDAIVNAANSTLAMTTGVAATITRKGGVLIEEEALRQGPVEVGEAVLTPGGNLAATHVIHAVVMGPDLKTDAEVVGRATRAVLVVADKHRLTSVALPALGTGVGQVAPGWLGRGDADRGHGPISNPRNGAERGWSSCSTRTRPAVPYRYVEKAGALQ